MTLVIILIGELILLFAAIRFKQTADELVFGLLVINERLLTDLCVRTQGGKQEEYRILRKATQEMLKEHKTYAWRII